MANPGRLSRVLPGALLLFVAAAFALPTEAAFSLVFYLCVLPPALLATPCAITRRPEAWLTVALIAWCGLTLAWGEGTPGRALGFLLGAVATAAFVRALWHVASLPDGRRHIAATLVWAGAANAAFVLLWHAPALLRGERITGWGITRQPILGGSVMAAACLTALAAAPGRPARLAAACVMVGFALAMQSRGVLVGLAGGLLLLGWGRWRWRVLLAVMAFCGVLAPVHERVLHLLLERGTSQRLDIWAEAWRQIAQRPLFGHGLAANLPISPTGFPHSLYLSLLFYIGAVGFCLFAALALLVTARLVRAAPGPERVWVSALWLNALLAGLTDFGQITKGPGPLWFILWLPIVLALSLPVRPRAAAAGLPSAAT